MTASTAAEQTPLYTKHKSILDERHSRDLKTFRLPHDQNTFCCMPQSLNSLCERVLLFAGIYIVELIIINTAYRLNYINV